ncbi:PREDICTED: uncharacterized protein LOC108564035 [Nicrophorus vespilloides]|uniref:Uncharacterized protein LOC108564035 n=1 Tax=Nicrophorus vespilloides TaxID=110193 RepID=A0ABM1MUZ3_NICVS|nr:PREDICTED: uncharacterized protein LOC108564035 [Nicrophorus vespilloides]
MESDTKSRAEEFVRRLLDEADDVPCDSTSEFFNKHEELPDFYDEEEFKRGQAFYHNHIFAMFFSKLLGLLTTLALPKANHILRMTKRSSDALSAYKRYVSTVWHMCVWYDNDFYPGSILWKSIADVKRKHDSASKRATCLGIGNISQKDMALAQFGFMGYQITSPKSIGIFRASDDEFRSFIHIWRTIGYAFGIEDRYNICREDLNETREICLILQRTVFKPLVGKMDNHFLDLSSALIQGMWVMNPILKTSVFLTYIWNILNESETNNNVKPIYELSKWEKLHLNLIYSVIGSLRQTVWRKFHNYNQKLTLFFMHYWPFLGYFVFGCVVHVQLALN